MRSNLARGSPDRPAPGLTTYDALDPDTAFFIDPEERLRVAMSRQ